MRRLQTNKYSRIKARFNWDIMVVHVMRITKEHYEKEDIQRN